MLSDRDAESSSSEASGSGSTAESDNSEGNEDDEEEEEDDESDVPVTVAVPVAMWDFDHCDPKKCSGKKLARHRLITSMRVGQRFRGIVLTWVGGLGRDALLTPFQT